MTSSFLENDVVRMTHTKTHDKVFEKILVVVKTRLSVMKCIGRSFGLMLCAFVAVVDWRLFRRRHYVPEFTLFSFASLMSSRKSSKSRGAAPDRDSSTNASSVYPTTSSSWSIINLMSNTSTSERNSYQPTTLSYPPNSCAGGWEFRSSSTIPPVTNSTIPPVTRGTRTVASLHSLNGSKVICASPYGRLGNQMFQYASLLGIALKTNRIPVFLGRSSLLHGVLRNTSIIENSLKYSSQCKEKYVSESGCCKFFPGFFDLDPNKNYGIGMFLASWRYFFEHEAEICEEMKFKDSIVSQAQKVVDSLRQKYNRTLTGVHVRRGDFIRYKYLGYNTEYLLRAMDYVRKRFVDVAFVISSDDVRWCQEQFANTSDVTVLPATSPPAVDMMTLGLLDHMIMTVGTFGWWASFLNPGITVYYRDFAHPGTSISAQFNPNGTDYYCPVWTSLS